MPRPDDVDHIQIITLDDSAVDSIEFTMPRRSREGDQEEPAEVSHGRLALHHTFMNQKIILMSPDR
jgi:hypothetical protein